MADPDTVWVGLEFFARDDDALDATVIRMPKAYPGYFGAAYERFDELRGWLDGRSNLFLVGRNGMHPLQQPGSLDAVGPSGRAEHPGR